MNPIKNRPRRVAFASIYSYFDSTNGASTATVGALELLSQLHFECQAFCGVRSLGRGAVSPERFLSETGTPFDSRDVQIGPSPVRIVTTRRGTVDLTTIVPKTIFPDPFANAPAFYAEFDRFLDKSRPDILLFIGADQIDLGLITIARRREIIVLFMIHNFDLGNVLGILGSDACVTPSEFASRYYSETIGASCRVLPIAVDWRRSQVSRREPKFVTFVNPSTEKGVYPFVKIAEELCRLRPDIPLLVVESRGTRRNLEACGMNVGAMPNLVVMPHVPDPRHFWSITRLCLMPSLWWENQPAVAIEAMINGIPVIGSDRGGIPEVLGDAGIVLPLPDRLTSTTRELPIADEVTPWVETIIRLWDFPNDYQAASNRARSEARRWHPDRLGPLYSDYFQSLESVARPPLRF